MEKLIIDKDLLQKTIKDLYYSDDIQKILLAEQTLNAILSAIKIKETTEEKNNIQKITIDKDAISEILKELIIYTEGTPYLKENYIAQATEKIVLSIKTKKVEKTEEPADDKNDIQKMIAEECDSIKNLLIEKNKAYGNSAIEPLRIFSKLDNIEQIKVRIDDKLSRILRGQQSNIQEDTEQDLIGYLILFRICKKIEVKK